MFIIRTKYSFLKQNQKLKWTILFWLLGFKQNKILYGPTDQNKMQTPFIRKANELTHNGLYDSIILGLK